LTALVGYGAQRGWRVPLGRRRLNHSGRGGRQSSRFDRDLLTLAMAKAPTLRDTVWLAGGTANLSRSGQHVQHDRPGRG